MNGREGRSRRQPSGKAVGIVALVVAGVVVSGVLLNSALGGDTAQGWACPAESIGMNIGSLADSGGVGTPQEAIHEWLPDIAKDSGVDLATLESAARSQSGSNRLEGSRLFIDGEIVASFGDATKLSDGSWAIGSYRSCMTPPDKADSPGPTPSDAA